MHNTPHTKESKLKMSIALKGKFADAKHNQWKGDKAGYRAIHQWIQRKLGKPHFCEHCGDRNLKHRQYQWANLDHKYKRNLNDWRRLCMRCHQTYDIANNNYQMPNPKK